MSTLPNKFRSRPDRPGKGAAPAPADTPGTPGVGGFQRHGSHTHPAPADMARESLAGGSFGGSNGFASGWGSLGSPMAVAGANAGRAASLYTLGRAADNLTRVFGPGVYADMARDPAVISSLNLLKQGVMSGGIQLAPAMEPDPDKDLARVTEADGVVVEDDPDDEFRKKKVELAKEIHEFCQWTLDDLPESIDITCLQLLDAMDLGCKLAEVTYRPLDTGRWKGKWGIASIKPKNGEAWAFVVDAYGNVAGYLATIAAGLAMPSWLASPGGTVGRQSASLAASMGGYDFLPPEKCAVFSWMPRDGDPRGRSILEPAYNAWNQKQSLLYFWAEYQSLFARPKILASPGTETMNVTVADANGNLSAQMVDTYTALQTTLTDLANLSYAVLPPGTSVSFLQPQGNGESFATMVEWADRQVALAVLQSTRATMEAEHGSKADSAGGQDNVGLTVRVARHALARMVRGVLRNLVRANYGDDAADELTPLVSLGGTEHQDRAAELTAAAAVGYTLDESQMARLDQKYNMPVRTVLTDEQKMAKAVNDAEMARKVMEATGGGVPPAQGDPDAPPGDKAPTAGKDGAPGTEGGRVPPALAGAAAAAKAAKGGKTAA